jgi:hypothetical protein
VCQDLLFIIAQSDEPPRERIVIADAWSVGLGVTIFEGGANQDRLIGTGQVGCDRGDTQSPAMPREVMSKMPR